MYKHAITDSMTELGRDGYIFVGYNTKIGLAGETLCGVDESQIIETPVAESLMAGIGLGLALAGKKTVVYFERFDFITNALDIIINHIDKIHIMSAFETSIILRVVVGNSHKPLYTGPTHTQNFSDGLRKILNMPVCELLTPESVIDKYAYASTCRHPIMLVEFKDLYE